MQSQQRLGLERPGLGLRSRALKLDAGTLEVPQGQDGMVRRHIPGMSEETMTDRVSRRPHKLEAD